MKSKRPLPKTPAGWLAEIADAFLDAREAVPFAALFGDRLEDDRLFHVAPDVAVKFRGLPRKRRAAAVEAALSSYVASKSRGEERGDRLFEDPLMAFAFCYLASHFGLDLVDESLFDEVMTFLEAHQKALRDLVDGARGG